MQQVADETTKVASTLQQFSNQQAQNLNISMPEATMTQLQGVMTAAQVSSTRISEGIQGAYAHAYPEAIRFYVDQLAGTLSIIETLQGHLTQLASNIQLVVDQAEEEQWVLQAQQQAKKQAERDRKHIWHNTVE